MRAVDSELGSFTKDSPSGLFRSAIVASISGDRDEVLRSCQALVAASEKHPDGEAIYAVTRMLAHAGWREMARKGLTMTINAGFFPAPTFERDPWLDDVRDEPEFQRLLARAGERCLAADAAFQAAGGYRLLGMRPRSSVGHTIA